MTNEELNLAIAKLVYPQFDFRYGDFASEVVGYLPNTNCWQVEKDYCNNWNDLMPLVVEHEITLAWDYVDKNWNAWTETSDVYTNNPQRALTECLLKVLEAKAEDY